MTSDDERDHGPGTTFGERIWPEIDVRARVNRARAAVHGHSHRPRAGHGRCRIARRGRHG